jgi:hypothetical protein
LSASRHRTSWSGAIAKTSNNTNYHDGLFKIAHLFRFGRFAENGKAGFLVAQVPLAFRHHLTTLIVSGITSPLALPIGPGRRNLTTGIAGFCARAATGPRRRPCHDVASSRAPNKGYHSTAALRDFNDLNLQGPKPDIRDLWGEPFSSRED